MLKYIYLAILAVLTYLVIIDMVRNKNLFSQIEAALVLIPFIMRLLLIK